MKLTIMLILMVVLVIIILYFFFRIRTTIKNAPGATNKMSTKELIKNWQKTKVEDNTYIEKIREKAKTQARVQAEPKIEKILTDQYEEQEIQKATTDQSLQFKDKLKTGLGIDVDKATSQESMNRILGKDRTGANGQVEPTNIFDRDKLKSYTTHGDINQQKIRDASGDSVNWGKGTKQALRTNMTFEGVERAVRRDSERVQPIEPKRRPPYRP